MDDDTNADADGKTEMTWTPDTIVDDDDDEDGFDKQNFSFFFCFAITFDLLTKFCLAKIPPNQSSWNVITMER